MVWLTEVSMLTGTEQGCQIQSWDDQSPYMPLGLGMTGSGEPGQGVGG